MKQCKRVPLECVNKCGVKNVPREEVSILKYVFLCVVHMIFKVTKIKSNKSIITDYDNNIVIIILLVSTTNPSNSIKKIHQILGSNFFFQIKLLIQDPSESHHGKVQTS